MVVGASSGGVQWPKFTMEKPDPVLGEVYAGKTSLSPELTLVEFISTSAAFHGVTSQLLTSLEEELLKVFPNNVMPANAAAWYMAKRKYYMNEPYDQQLLPFLLKKFPEKFRLLGKKVIFLEVYDREAARQKLSYLVTAGLHAYFNHKAEEYGVYFFDPRYYQTTEPFHAALRLACPRDSSAMLVQRYFATEGMKAQFTYKQHTAFLVSISKQGSNVKVVTNHTGVIVSMINSQYGFIKFGAGEKALFSAKSLFKDGWQFSGDPLKLPAMKFDGYQLMQSDKSKEKEKHTWYAVLVWCGRRPSPQYCSSTEDLNSTPMFRERHGSQAGECGNKSRRPSQTMCVGEVAEVRRDGAVVKSREDEVAEVWLPGWRRKLANRPGTWLSTVDGECIGVGDIVAFYTSSEARKGFSAVGRNVALLKENEGQKAGRSRRSTCCSDDLQGIRRDSARDFDSESEEELSVSEGELEWLEQDLESVIAMEDPKAKTIDLLRAVQINLQEVRGKPGRRKSLKKGDKPGYKQLPPQPSDFRRMKKMMAELEADGYRSDSDEEYYPGDEVDEVDSSDEEETTDGGDSSFCVSGDGDGRRKKNRARGNTVSSMASTVSTSATALSVGDSRENKKMGNLPFWVAACSLPEVFDPQLGKFVPLDRSYKEDQDPDYKLPEDDKDWLSDLEELDEVEDNLEEEVKCLIEEAEEPVSESHRDVPVASPVKVTLTPAKENADEHENVEEEEEEVTLVDDGEVDAPRRPLLWEVELLLTEQKEEDDEKDLEYVPPSTCLEISLDYDEYSDGEISDDELQALKVDQQTQPSVPSDYIAVWVKVDSPMERINQAKEEHADTSAGEEQRDVFAKSETGGKEFGADINGAIKSLSGCSDGGKLGLEVGEAVRRKSVSGNSSCSNLSGGSNSRRKSASRKSSFSEAEAMDKAQREQKESIASQLEDGDVKKQSPVVVLGSQTTSKVIIGDGDSSSVSEVSEGVA